MPVSKVNFAGNTLIDLTEDTVTEDTLAYGVTAHDAAGNAIEGSIPPDMYATCATAAGTAAKVASTISGKFALVAGAMVRVKFTNANTYNGTATLNVDGTGTKNITRVGTTTTTRYFWSAGEVVDFVYDGTNFVMVRTGIATTTYYGLTKLATSAVSTSAALALTPASLNNLAQYMLSGVGVYSASATYAVGDRVRYGYYIYECIVAITTAEAWNAEHWKVLDPLQVQIDNLSAQIAGLLSLIHMVSNDLTLITTTNTATAALAGQPYSATLTANSGYDIDAAQITMGGVDITSTAYDSGVINIPNVTGDIVITATAIKHVNYKNQVPISTDVSGNVYNGTGYKDGYRLNSSGAEGTQSGDTLTGFIPFSKGDTIRLGGDGITFTDYGCMMYFYDADKNPVSGKGVDYSRIGNSGYGTWDTTEDGSVFAYTPNNTYPSASITDGYVRVSAKGSGANMIVTINEVID